MGYKLRRVKPSGSRLDGVYAAMVKGEKQDTITDLQNHNKHLTEKLNRTVSALLTLQETQEKWRKDNIELRQRIKQAKAHQQFLQSEIKIQEREEKHWRKRYEMRDLVSPRLENVSFHLDSARHARTPSDGNLMQHTSPELPGLNK